MIGTGISPKNAMSVEPKQNGLFFYFTQLGKGKSKEVIYFQL